MQGPLFRPDLFSRRLPSYTEPDEIALQSVKEIIAHDYRSVIGQNLRISQTSGNNVNSRNFRIASSRGQFVLKHIPQAGLRDHESTCHLSAFLNSRGAAVVYPEKNDKREFVSRDEQAGWSLWPFFEGDYFSGGEQELRGIADAVQGLSKHLSTVPADASPTRRVEVNVSDMVATIRNIDSSWNDWVKTVDETMVRLVADNRPVILKALSGIETTAAKYEFSQLLPVHYDLHPHNILVKEGHIAAILDTDSIVMYAPMPSLGFAAFKLFRQHVAHLESEEPGPELREDFERFSNQLAPEYSAQEMLEGARIEVMRRMCDILGNLDTDGKSVWGHVFGIHLSALSEISWLLGESS